MDTLISNFIILILALIYYIDRSIIENEFLENWIFLPASILLLYNISSFIIKLWNNRNNKNQRS